MSVRVFLLLSFCFVSQLSEAKCNTDPIKGRWIGTFESIASGNTFPMELTISAAKKCAFSGVAHWPTYYDSKVTIAGEQFESIYSFQETDLLQGPDDVLGESRYEFTMNEEGLSGTVFVGGEEWSTFELRLWENLHTDEQAAWQQEVQEATKKYGESSIGDELPMSECQALVDRQLEASQVIKSNAKSLEVKGTMTFQGGFSAQVYLAMVQPNSSYMRMDLQELLFYEVQNDSIAWSYNGAEDQLEVKPAERESDRVLLQMDMNHYMDSLHQKVIGCRQAMIRGREALRVKTTAESDEDAETKVFYLDRTTSDVLREESDGLMDYGGYQTIDGIELPRWFINASEDQVIRLDMDSIALNKAISSDLFEIPEELTRKLKPTTKTANDNNDLGNVAAEDEDYEEAIERYSKAIARNPQDFMFFYNRGVAQQALQKHYEAIADFNRSLELNDAYSNSWNRLGLAKYRLGDYNNAIPDFSKAINLDSTFEAALLNRGFAHAALGQLDESIADFRTLTQLDTTNADYAYNLGYVLAEKGQREEALMAYGQSVA
ncbi:MAG: tetratricopeptide repeat protein, partial [Bacteroidota bacterium]